jgi:hypothetical protein
MAVESSANPSSGLSPAEHERPEQRATPETVPAGAIRTRLVRALEYLAPSHEHGWKEFIAAIIAFSIIGGFFYFLGFTLNCVLYAGPCDHGVEMVNLVGHIFGPIIGAIVAFYFAHLIILRKMDD